MLRPLCGACDPRSVASSVPETAYPKAATEENKILWCRGQSQMDTKPHEGERLLKLSKCWVSPSAALGILLRAALRVLL